VTGKLPLRPGLNLDYLGFSDTRMLCAADSAGLLMGLLPSCGWQWVPLLDTGAKARAAAAKAKARAEARGGHEMDIAAAVLAKINAQPKHWIIGVARSRLMCVLCRGDDKFPATLPKPVPTAVDLKMPMLQLATQSGSIEEAWTRGTLLLRQRMKFVSSGAAGSGSTEAELEAAIAKEKVQLDKYSFQMIQLACKADKQVRALDVATRLRNPKAYEIAVTLATKLRKHNLAERIHLLMRARAARGWQENGFDEEESEEDEGDDGEDDIFSNRGRNRAARKSRSRRGRKAEDERRKGGAADYYRGELQEQEFDFSAKNPKQQREELKERRRQARRARAERKRKGKAGKQADDEEDEEEAQRRFIVEEGETSGEGSSGSDDSDDAMDEDDSDIDSDDAARRRRRRKKKRKKKKQAESEEEEFDLDGENAAGSGEGDEEDDAVGSKRKRSQRKSKSRANAAIGLKADARKAVKKARKKAKEEEKGKKKEKTAASKKGKSVQAKISLKATDDAAAAPPARKLNPFARAAGAKKKKPGNERTLLGALQNSPVKRNDGTPKLNRQSSFAAEVRQQ